MIEVCKNWQSLTDINWQNTKKEVLPNDQIKNLVLQRDTRENIMAMQTIDLKKLDLMQLTQIKNQLDQDLQFYQESLGNLKHAQTK